jgi:hypothetical protein
MNSENLHVLADMLEAGGALETVATGDMGFGRDPVTLLEIRHIFTNLNDLCGIFMSEKERDLDPGGGVFIPLINMDVRTANGCRPHFD